MQICFIKDGTALTLPVTPAGYAWGVGRNMETINISQLGDVYRPGGRSRFSGEALECLLPAQNYPWMEPGAIADPQYYLDILTAWAAAGEPVRYIVSGTENRTGRETYTPLYGCGSTQTWRRGRWPRRKILCP